MYTGFGNGSRFTYDTSNNRITQVIEKEVDSKREVTKKIYIAGMEQDETVTNPDDAESKWDWEYEKTRIFINTPGGLIGMHVQNARAKATAKCTISRKYFHLDHLGSIVAASNARGDLIAEYSYDAWGKRRDATTWQALAPSSTLPTYETDRGFTGHEMLDHIGLVHMNGRIYDSTLGRFLSADPHVQAPSNLQSFNRYAYVLNNPLRYTDPTGYYYDTFDPKDWHVDSKFGTRHYNNLSDWSGYGGSGDKYNRKSAKNVAKRKAAVSRTNVRRAANAYTDYLNKKAKKVAEEKQAQLEQEAREEALRGIQNKMLSGAAKLPPKATYNSTIAYINEYRLDNHGDVIPLNTGQLDALMGYDMKYADSMNFDKMGSLEFMITISGDYGDGSLYDYVGCKFSYKDPNDPKGRSRTFLAADVNYYYQGIAAAARGRRGGRQAMNLRIGWWNTLEYLRGNDWVGDRVSFRRSLGQIFPALYWARKGYNYYKENE